MQANELLKYAEFALASYYDHLFVGAPQSTVLQGEGDGMSKPQADAFAAQHLIALPTYSHFLSDFQATVFKDAGGNLTLAIRGTEGLLSHDFLITDIMIADDGAAFDQLIELYNWWLRVGSEEGTLVPQYRLKPFTEFEVEQWTTTTATGEITAALASDPDGKIDVTGHSLGGHLAMAFNTLFPEKTGKVVVFNAPGFENNVVVQQFFAELGGQVPVASNSTNIVNVVANEAIIGEQPTHVVPGLYPRLGAMVDISIENQMAAEEPDSFGAFNHSIVALSDTLAVYELLSRLDPTLTPHTYSRLLSQSTMGTAASYARIVDGLQKLLGIDNVDLPYGNNNRDALYTAIYGLHEHAGFNALAGHVRIDADASAISRGDFGAILSLHHLTPFVLHAIDPHGQDMLMTWNEDVAIAWLQDNVDTEAKEESGDLNFSDRWIADRTQMLQWRHAMQAEDNPNWLPQTGIPVAFEDKATGLTAPGPIATQNLPLQQQVIFGADSNETIEGKERDDRLYGGGGDDTIKGGGGHDYIEGNGGVDEIDGGSGDDTLLGGEGEDILRGGTGNDTIKGGRDRDEIFGGEGNDTIYGGQGNDEIEGGNGVASVNGSPNRRTALLDADSFPSVV